MGDFRDVYERNAELKLAAQAYVKNPTRGSMFELLAEIVARISEECEVIVPMIMEGERISYDTISDGQDEWIQVFTDWEELTLKRAPEYIMGLPIRCVVEDAFESRKAEGIILNLHSDEVFLGKEELDWVLEMLALRGMNEDEEGM